MADCNEQEQYCNTIENNERSVSYNTCKSYIVVGKHTKLETLKSMKCYLILELTMLNCHLNCSLDINIVENELFFSLFV